MEVDFPTLPPNVSGDQTYCIMPYGSNSLPSNGYIVYVKDIQPSNSFWNSNVNPRYVYFTYRLDGNKLFLQGFQNASQDSYPNAVTRGYCLSEGDIVYKPEYKDFIFPFGALISFIFILGLVYKIIIKRLLP